MTTLKQWALTFAAVLATFSIASAQQVDAQKLVQDLQITRQGAQGMRMVWWTPVEYWDSAMTTSLPSAEQRAAALKGLQAYEIFAVLEGKIGMMGVLAGSSRDELIKKVSLQTDKGVLKPLAETELSTEAQNFVQTVKPLLAGMLGQLGQNMHFMVFKGTDSSGKRLLDPRQSGNFKFMLGDEAFAWRLPLGSLLPPKFDSESGEQFPGNYLFSPFTGKKLLDRK